MLLNPKYDAYKNYYDSGMQAYDNGDIGQAKQLLIKAANIAKDLADESISQDVKEFYSKAYAKLSEWLNNSNQADSATKTFLNVAKPQTKWFKSEIPNVTMEDVAGLKEVKAQVLINILAPLNYPDIYFKYRKDVGARILLYGPPGTGKTLVAEAIAGTLKCALAVVQSKDILASLVGDAEKNIGEVFEEAKKYDRSIIFLDEIDALAADRESEDSRHTKGVLTTMLSMMDGFAARNKPGQLKIIIAATNRPWIIDSALKRGKRFDSLIYVGLPDNEARSFIIKKCLEKDVVVPRAEDVTIEWLSKRLDGYAGADIVAICTKIINKPLGRALKRAIKGEANRDEIITQADCIDIISKYINPITQEMLTEYELYGKID